MQDYSDKFKEGTVLMINSKLRNLYNRVVVDGIRFFTKCKYHHAGIVGKRGHELWVYEAVAKGFVPTKELSEWLKDEGVRFELAVFNPLDGMDTSLEVLRERLYSIAGSPYDFGSLIVWQVIYQLTGKWIGKRGQQALGRIYCTEGVAYIIGLENWWTYDPTKLYDKLLQLEVDASIEEDRDIVVSIS